MNPSKRFLRLAALSRRLDLPYGKALFLLRSGALLPDAVDEKENVLFDESRVSEIRKLIAERNSRLSKKPLQRH